MHARIRGVRPLPPVVDVAAGIVMVPGPKGPGGARKRSADPFPGDNPGSSRPGLKGGEARIMPFRAGSLSDLVNHGRDTLIDVRSPSEYAEDHVPGAISLPVLSDAERARVGTIYVQEDPFLARKIGAAIVARNAAAHLEGPLADKPGGWRPLLYCWRGGQRSGSFASILGQIGWRAETVEGGYRTWRRLVVERLYHDDWPCRVVLLDGYTGSAKTDLLARAATRGAQVMDLEGIARHRGSLFGDMGAQPSQKRFETDLAMAALRLDPARPLLVEAESSRIGQRLIPPALWKAMRWAPRIAVDAPREARVAYTIDAYADFAADRERLDATVASLRPLVGRDACDRWRAMAAAGALRDLVDELLERHYDPRYAKSRQTPRITLEAPTLDAAGLDALADRVAASVARLA
jgi:tRNA 2-selenouridine synthase